MSMLRGIVEYDATRNVNQLHCNDPSLEGYI